VRGFLVDTDGQISFSIDGKPVLTDGPETELFLAIAIPRGEYIGDPDAGSRIPSLIRETHTDIDDRLVEAATEAISPLVRLGIVSLDNVQVSDGELGVKYLDISTTNQGQFQVAVTI